MTLAAVRAELKGAKGKKYWRSLDELANTPEFQAAVEREFPSAAQEWVDPVSRRGFLKLMGASMALAGLAGCTKQPDEPIYPYVKAPEDLILGKPMYFATAHPFTTGAVPLLVKSDEFRPIKIDGNPEHAYNHGGSDPYSQGTLLDLYDPDRSQHVLYRGEGREWGEFAEAFREKVASTKDGTGIYFLSATITSPTLARQWRQSQKAYPKAKLVQYDPAIAGTLLDKRPERSVRPEPGRRDRLARRGFSLGRELSGLPQTGARLRRPAQAAGKRHEPALRGREHADHDGHEGRASAGAARERDSGVCGGAGAGCGRAGRECARAMRGPPSSRSFSPHWPRI